jgi:hypothetical protein
VGLESGSKATVGENRGGRHGCKARVVATWPRVARSGMGELLQRDNMRPHAAHLARTVSCQHGRGGHQPSNDATVRQGRHVTVPPQQRRQGMAAHGTAAAAPEPARPTTARPNARPSRARPRCAPLEGDREHQLKQREQLPCMIFKARPTAKVARSRPHQLHYPKEQPSVLLTEL